MSTQQTIIRIFDRNSAIETINKLGEDDLRFLNHLIVDRINFLTHFKRRDQLSRFYPVDKARFKTADGEEKIGTVIRINQKTLSVNTGQSDSWWKLSPGLVRKVEGTEPDR